MDVRSIEDVAPVVEHNGTVPVWWLVNPREMKDITDGGYLELVSEFEVAGGGLVDPHSHPTHEFYYVTAGRGIMTIDGEEREIGQGDLVHIPPNLVHSLRPVSDHAPIHCFCFAVGVKDARAGRLHGPLTRAWRASSSPAGCPTAGSTRWSTPATSSSRRDDDTPVHARRARRRRVGDVDAIVCLLTDRIDAAVLDGGRRPAAGRRERRGRLRQHRRRRGRPRSASRCATRPACSTRRPPTSRSC